MNLINKLSILLLVSIQQIAFSQIVNGSCNNSAQHQYKNSTKDWKDNPLLKYNTVTVQKEPIANFIISDSGIDKYFPYNATFMDNSIHGNGKTFTYSWSINGQVFSTETNPNYLFEYQSTYHITLNITDNLGFKSEHSDILIIKDPLQKDEFDYITGECTDNVWKKYEHLKHFNINNDKLEVYGYTVQNCCTQKTATFEIKNDTVFITTFQVGERCTCNCSFSFKIEIPNISDINTHVFFDNEQVFINENNNTNIDSKTDSSVNIFPVPTNNYLTVEFQNPDSNNYHIEICDMYGHISFKQEEINSPSIQLNVMDLKPGIYLIKISDSYNIIHIDKFVIK